MKYYFRKFEFNSIFNFMKTSLEPYKHTDAASRRDAYFLCAGGFAPAS